MSLDGLCKAGERADCVPILSEFGYDANRITELARQGIIATGSSRNYGPSEVVATKVLASGRPRSICGLQILLAGSPTPRYPTDTTR